MDLQDELKALDDGRGFPYVGYKAARASLILAQEIRDLRVTLIDLSVKSDARLHQKE